MLLTHSYFLVKNLSPGKTYVFRINSHTLTSQASSEKVTYIIQRKIKDKAITAGIVGGILFFIVAIILAVCTVKCVNKRNKRRRREQENGNFLLWLRFRGANIFFTPCICTHVVYIFALIFPSSAEWNIKIILLNLSWMYTLLIRLSNSFVTLCIFHPAYSMVACQMSADTRNGCQSGSAKSVPSRK